MACMDPSSNFPVMETDGSYLYPSVQSVAKKVRTVFGLGWKRRST